jgi:hypothetical protein
VFDILSNDFGYKQFKNSTSGFLKFLEHLCNKSWCIMEYTGSYYQQLAMFLYQTIPPCKISMLTSSDFNFLNDIDGVRYKISQSENPSKRNTHISSIILLYILNL